MQLFSLLPTVMLKSVDFVHKTSDILMRKMVLSSLVLCHNFATTSSLEATKSKSHIGWTEPVGYDTNISVYNPLTKQKTKLILQNENIAKWYGCGPTVYDSAHIGHASCYVKLDIIRRILMNVFDIDVFYLMGVTDIDDKIIIRSNELKEDFRSLSKKYEIEFFKDLDKLNVLPPTMTVRVSDHIRDIVSFVDKIVKNGHGYKVPSGSVYFDAEGFAGYGKLYPPQLSEEPRKPNSEKRSPLDFSLWKAVKPGEPCWDSPWGPGRPGWHIECSAMASKVLGPCLDIHSGGQDLMFPHHENEEAQSCSHHNTSQWVNYWLHIGHLLVKDDVKMSKSLKNTISIPELLDSYSSNHFRMLCLLSPYRNRIEYSPETMSTAVGNCRRIESFLDECELYLSGVKPTGDISEADLIKNIQLTKATIRTLLADDFDTSRAMDEVMRFVSAVNTMLAKPYSENLQESKPRSTVAVTAASQFVKKTMGDLGMTFASEQSAAAHGDARLLSTALDAALELRSTTRDVALQPHMGKVAKSERNLLLKACDEIRNTLFSAGVEIKDHKGQKSTWSLKDVVKLEPDKDR